MNRKHKGIQIFLAISFIFFLSVFSAYLYYDNYAETDLPSAKPTFDNPDQDYLLINQETKPLALGQNTFPFILETYLLCQLPLLSSGMLSLGQKPFVLRC
jgi:heme/copper-type cytochrome/quinol oxidase subunit 3